MLNYFGYCLWKLGRKKAKKDTGNILVKRPVMGRWQVSQARERKRD